MNDQGEQVHLDQTLAYRVHRAARLLRIHLIRLLDTHGKGMTPEQYFVFYRAYNNNGCPQGDLADPLLEDYSNVTRLVDSLVRRELLVRRPDPNDRRRHQIFLTQEGHDLAQKLIPLIKEERQLLYGDLQEKDIQVFLSTLEKIEKRAEERASVF